MSEEAGSKPPFCPGAQPFTFGGVALFPEASFGRFCVAVLLTDFFACACLMLFLQHAWLPAWTGALQKMPETARLERGILRGVETNLITQTKFLAIAITPDGSDQIGQSADLQIQLRPNDYRFGSVFRPDWGWESAYPESWSRALGRSTLEPWWGAWQPVILAVTGLAAALFLGITWTVLAWIYTFPARFFAALIRRRLTWGGAWRLSLASLLPGAVFIGVGFILYGWGRLDLAGFCVVFALHFLIGWIYLLGGILACPKSTPTPSSSHHNPFSH